jgi:hypothetical protein
MTCYMRNLRSMFDTLGVEYDKANRVRVDRAIRSIVGTPDGAHCPEVWSAVKSLSPQESADLPAKIAERLRTPDAGTV